MAENFWRDRPTLITGATGLLGSWLTKQLLELETDVVCLIRDWVPQSELVRSGNLEKIKIVRGDIRDYTCMERIIAEYEIQTIFHLAAQTIVGTANQSPISTFETNIQGTWSILEACRNKKNVESIVVASSDKAYGDHEVLPYDETHPLQGKHPYDVSKSCTDLIAQTYAQTYGLPVAISRCGNLFGGGDLNWNRIIPGTIRSILRNQPPIVRSNGQSLRDYFYVEDAVFAYIVLAEQLTLHPHLKGEAFNFSNETPLRVIEVVETLLNLTSRSDLLPVILGEASNEILNQHLSAQKAHNLLSWKAQYSLKTGLTKTLEWYEAYFNTSPASLQS